LCHLHEKNVKVVGAFVHLGEKAKMAIPNAQDPMLDIHARVILIQLSQADDEVPQRGDVVDAGEQSKLAGLGSEDDGTDTLDLHGGGIPKLDGASNAGVELGEELPPPGHVVGSAGVEVPPVDLVAARPVVEKDVGPCLVEVEERGGSRRGRGVRLDAPVYEEQSRLITLLACATCA
jgi:hypothetical protein